jgi:hypothetical protein
VGPVLAAVLGFMLVAEATRPHVPLPDDVEVEARLEQLSRDATGYDVVVIGASTVMRAFDPAVFDAEVGARGFPLRSFNLGVPGAFQLEVDHLIEELLARARVKPRWILVELPTRRLDKLLPPVNLFTDRAVYWHTPRETLAWFRAAARSARTGEAPHRGLDVLRHAAWRWASLGQGDRIAVRALGIGEAAREAHVAEAARTRGFRPFPVGPDAPQSDLRDEFLASPEWYRGVVARVDAVNGGPPPRRVLDPAWLASQEAHARAQGAEIVYITTPTILHTAEIHALHRAGAIPVLLAFDSPSRDPDLYEAENRFDAIHLNEVGARLFSRRLGDRFAGWLKKQRS